MILMPYYVVLNQSCVQKTKLLKNKNNITACSSDFNDYFLNGKYFNKNKATIMKSVNSKVKEILEVLIKVKNQMIFQNLFMKRKSFLFKL